jgi:hypothetical protein
MASMHRVAVPYLLVLLTGCAGSVDLDGGVDAEAPRDAGGEDSGVDDGGAIACNPERFVGVGGGRDRLEVGVFCDDVQVAAEDEQIARRIEEAYPAFVCEARDEAYRCTVNTETLTAEEVAGFCAVTLIEPPLRVECWVYV